MGSSASVGIKQNDCDKSTSTDVEMSGEESLELTCNNSKLLQNRVNIIRCFNSFHKFLFVLNSEKLHDFIKLSLTRINKVMSIKMLLLNDEFFLVFLKFLAAETGIDKTYGISIFQVNYLNFFLSF